MVEKMKKLILTLSLLHIFSLPSFAQDELAIYTYSSFTSDWGPGPKLKEAFEKECHCIVTFVGLDDGVSILNRLKLEGSSTKADIILGLDMGLIEEVKKYGLVQKHNISLSETNLQIEWADDYFIPYDYSYFAFIYDENKLPNPPESFHDLVHKFDGKLIIQDPRTSSVGQGLLFWVNTLYSQEEIQPVWQKLSEKILTVTKGWSEAYGLLLKGEADMVLSYTTSPAYHKLAENKHHYKAAMFQEGHYLQIETISIIKNNKNQKLADSFLYFMLTKKAQKILAMNNWMLPVINIDNELDDVFHASSHPQKALSLSSKDIVHQRQNWIRVWLNSMNQ